MPAPLLPSAAYLHLCAYMCTAHGHSKQLAAMPPQSHARSRGGGAGNESFASNASFDASSYGSCLPRCCSQHSTNHGAQQLPSCALNTGAGHSIGGVVRGARHGRDVRRAGARRQVDCFPGPSRAYHVLALSWFGERLRPAIVAQRASWWAGVWWVPAKACAARARKRPCGALPSRLFRAVVS